MFYCRLGQLPHKRHTQFRKADGSLHHEELMGIHGFTGNKSLLYHLRPPTAVERIDGGWDGRWAYAPQGPVRHRLLKTSQLPEQGDAVGGRVPLMGNADVRMSVARPLKAMDYWYRYADGDEVIFVHEGIGVLDSHFMGRDRPVGRVHRAGYGPDAVVHQRRRVRGLGHDGGHVGDGRFVRADRQERAPVRRGRHRRRP